MYNYVISTYFSAICEKEVRKAGNGDEDCEKYILEASTLTFLKKRFILHRKFHQGV